MRVGWRIEKLADICSIELGATPARKMSKFYDKDKKTNNIWLSIADMPKTIGQELFDSKEYLSDEGAGKVRLVKKGTLLFSFKLSIGRICFAGKDLRTNEAIAALDVKDSRHIDRKYLAWFLASQDWDLITAQDDKLLGRTLNKAKLKEFPVIVPPLPEQKRIVAILDEAFAGIDATIANTKKNLASARELFDSTLNTIFIQKGEGWEETTLGRVYDVRDGTHDSPKYQSEGYPLITSKNLKQDGLSFEKISLISEKDYQDICKRSAVHKGDVLFAMIGTIGNPIVVEVEPNFAIKNVALFKVGNKRSGEFLKYYLGTKFVINKMMSESKGTTQKFVGLGYLRSFPISAPTPEEELIIVETIKEYEQEVLKLEDIYQQKLASLNELKQSLLQKAFRGELTADANKIAEAAE